MNSIASQSPIVGGIVKQLIQNIELKNYKTKEKHRIDTNIIPKISEKTPKITKELFSESILTPEIKIEQPIPIQQIQIENPRPIIIPHKNPIQPQRIPIAQNNASRIQQIPVAIKKPSYGYGKLSGLIQDPGVAYIECYSPNTPIVVMKNGQNQTTNVSLNEEEIKSFFEYVSEKSKIPLSEGVFKVIFDGMLLNAIASETIGAKFIIKKNVNFGPGLKYE
jgi:hypothetical protein